MSGPNKRNGRGRMRLVSFALPDTLYDLIKEAMQACGVTNRSMFLRIAIAKGIAEIMKDREGG